ncbi:MAG: hypothetical protein LC749_18230 [Actinobacteria bacterium]|nr:hypothetical protein [Actinomycetota bacterium]
MGVLRPRMSSTGESDTGEAGCLVASIRAVVDYGIALGASVVHALRRTATLRRA